jgi:hypothetical protein
MYPIGNLYKIPELAYCIISTPFEDSEVNVRSSDENPDWSRSQIITKLAKMWKATSPEGKLKYEVLLFSLLVWDCQWGESEAVFDVKI